MEKQFQDNCAKYKRSKSNVYISPETRGRVAHVAMATLKISKFRKRPRSVAPASKDARFSLQAIFFEAATGRVRPFRGAFPCSSLTLARFFHAFRAFQAETHTDKA